MWFKYRDWVAVSVSLDTELNATSSSMEMYSSKRLLWPPSVPGFKEHVLPSGLYPSGMHQICLGISASSSHLKVWASPRFSEHFVVGIKTTLTKTSGRRLDIRWPYVCFKICPLWDKIWKKILFIKSISVFSSLRQLPENPGCCQTPSFELLSDVAPSLPVPATEPSGFLQMVLEVPRFRSSRMICCTESILPSALFLSSVRLTVEGLKLDYLSVI